ncbi:Disulfide bond formation protein DsbB [Limimonas halophila]|uniref:Disulfide bond formation protein DsbB n=1 Tax=Limimonas halophila TaxID=1082479 RepID=A0A1G7STG0_9PROT|nr:disulfide bond formation protein B [Limimonas halophila]SDG26238.1 Disulfide bond formation protein DsbB [Limimonas halophila]
MASEQDRLALIGLAAVSAAALIFAFVGQYGFGLEPCTLCVWQRYPHGAAIAAAAIGALAAPAGWPRRAALVICALVFLTGAGIAGFHVGVEQGWWEGLPGCAAPTIDPDMSAEELRAVLEAREQVVPCDEPAFVFLGVSMAGWNLLLSLALVAAAAWAAIRRTA